VTEAEVEDMTSGWEMAGDAAILADAALEWWLCHRPVPVF
jgi:hypothetical protein